MLGDDTTLYPTRDGDLEFIAHARHDVPELAAALEMARQALSWALDLIDQYDEKLIALGQRHRAVYSEHHMAGKRKARAALGEDWAEK